MSDCITPTWLQTVFVTRQVVKSETSGWRQEVLCWLQEGDYSPLILHSQGGDQEEGKRGEGKQGWSWEDISAEELGKGWIQKRKEKRIRF